MASIVKTTLDGIGDKLVVETVLTASNVLTYVQGTKQVLRLRNATAGPLTPVLTGSLSTAQVVPRVGTVNFAAGWVCQSIPAGAVRDIRLDTIADYIRGTINIANGTGLVATLIDGV